MPLHPCQELNVRRGTHPHIQPSAVARDHECLLCCLGLLCLTRRRLAGCAVGQRGACWKRLAALVSGPLADPNFVDPVPRWAVTIFVNLGPSSSSARGREVHTERMAVLTHLRRDSNRERRRRRPALIRRASTRILARRALARRQGLAQAQALVILRPVNSDS